MLAVTTGRGVEFVNPLTGELDTACPTDRVAQIRATLHGELHGEKE